MKTYKQKRKDLEERFSRQPKKIKHSLWMKQTRRVAMDIFRFVDLECENDDDLWYDFVTRMEIKIGELNCDVYELRPYFTLYKQYISKLNELDKKSKFLKQHYKPLEDDLFEV